jgi:hypothetical protein
MYLPVPAGLAGLVVGSMISRDASVQLAAGVVHPHRPSGPAERQDHLGLAHQPIIER